MPRIAPEVRQERRQLLIDAAWRCAASSRFRNLTIDDICAAAGVSKGTFYGYFASKQDLLLALLDEDAAVLDRVMDDLAAAPLGGTERVRRFTQAMLNLGDDQGRSQVRADLWAEILTEEEVRARLSATIERRRVRLRGWIEEGIAAGDFVAMPANAGASILLALGDGLLLHAGLDATAFRWANIRRALDILLAGDRTPGAGPAAGNEASLPDHDQEASPHHAAGTAQEGHTPL
ncbi:MAG TPA: helix-turn-helix domain-containing protein [Chloroflexota bacterium]|nr:helix-turn-helix domain-containing protein [Chloroflexota bacterium]